MSSIQDRTKENLGTTDKGIVLYRRLLVDSINKNLKGESPLIAAPELTGPPTIDGIGPTANMDQYWKDADAQRRRQARWK